MGVSDAIRKERLYSGYIFKLDMGTFADGFTIGHERKRSI